MQTWADREFGTKGITRRNARQTSNHTLPTYFCAMERQVQLDGGGASAQNALFIEQAKRNTLVTGRPVLPRKSGFRCRQPLVRVMTNSHEQPDIILYQAVPLRSAT